MRVLDRLGNPLDIGYRVATGRYVRHSHDLAVGNVTAFTRVMRNGKLSHYVLNVRVDNPPSSQRRFCELKRKSDQVVRVMESLP